MNGPITKEHQNYLQKCLDQIADNILKVTMVTVDDEKILQISGYNIGYKEELGANRYFCKKNSGEYHSDESFRRLCSIITKQVLGERLEKIQPPISKQEASEKVLNVIAQSLLRTCPLNNIYGVETKNGVGFCLQLDKERSVRVFIQASDIENAFIDDDEDEFVVIPE